MPSTQVPPIAGVAIDPPSLRPPIDDAAIERVVPSELRLRLETLKAGGYDWQFIPEAGKSFADSGSGACH